MATAKIPKVIKVTYREQTLEFETTTNTTRRSSVGAADGGEGDGDGDGETIAHLADRVAQHISVDVSRIRLFFMPRPGLLKHPFPNQPLGPILQDAKTRIRVVAAPEAEVKKLEDDVAHQKQRQRTGNPPGNRGKTVGAGAGAGAGAVKANKYRDWRKEQDEAQYTFHAIEPLPYLPNPEKSRRFLQRLANDPGIKASMRKHRFSVGLLTEMNPVEHTSSSLEGTSRTLGLNRNMGQVIELRLRTDAFDGYRDYKVIRKTLCHELSHNVHSNHDRQFWDLTKQIEREVERNDTLLGGRRLTDQEFYNPDDAAAAAADDDDNQDDAHDHGGWTGGDFVLGRSKPAQGQGQSEEQQDGDAGLSRREIMARAAMARMNQKQIEQKETTTRPETRSDDDDSKPRSSS